MPSTSKKQARFMRACANNWKPQRGKCPPMKVSREFSRADQAVSVEKEKS